MEKIKYKITKDKDFLGKRFETYTISRRIWQSLDERYINKRNEQENAKACIVNESK